MSKSACSRLPFRFVSFLGLLLWLAAVQAPAQTNQQNVLVIEGGTLIDGNGGAPVR
ncbi:MAG: hypothetical protein IH935_04455, partial [Acidobacteria bacterium]|nr:hypothetical protein [Acidobacteriota bacterium]